VAEVNQLNSKERILRLFQRQPLDRRAFFSGQGMVTLPAINSLGLRFPQIHLSAEAMASAAWTSRQRYDFDAVVIPYDMCTVPEAMGLKINFYEDSADVLYPTIAFKWASPEEVVIPKDILEHARMPLVSQALHLLRTWCGDNYALGTWLLGPFTMAGQLIELDVLLKLTGRERSRVERLLDELVEVIIHIGRAYQEMGVDYISLREMGVGCDILSPAVFKTLIQPRVKRVLEAWKPPRVLHICGSTDPIIELMKECGAEALSVDHKNDLAQSRRKVGEDILLFGNLDAYYLLGKATTVEVCQAVKQCLDAGADAVWPGCDIWPEVREENMMALAEAIRGGMPLWKVENRERREKG